MGDSKAYPVFRSTDAAEAYAQGQRLCALMERRDGEAELFAELLTVGDARRLASLLPDAFVDYGDARSAPMTGAFPGRELDVATADDAALEAALPLTIAKDVPLGSVEGRFVQALGQGMAAIDWHGLWPDNPATDSFSAVKYDGVQVVFHSADSQLARRAEHHSVLVHVGKMGDMPRARHLAACLGSEVLGESQIGW